MVMASRRAGSRSSEVKLDTTWIQHHRNGRELETYNQPIRRSGWAKVFKCGVTCCASSSNGVEQFGFGGPIIMTIVSIEFDMGPDFPVKHGSPTATVSSLSIYRGLGSSLWSSKPATPIGKPSTPDGYLWPRGGGTMREADGP